VGEALSDFKSCWVSEEGDEVDFFLHPAVKITNVNDMKATQKINDTFLFITTTPFLKIFELLDYSK
jgi:hypothetical protein